MLGRIRSATQRMGNLIDDLLELSRVTRTEMHKEPMSLTAVVEEVTSELQSGQPDRTIDVVIEEEVFANADERLMHIVLENLMRNAWKFTSHHDAARIEFGTVKVDGTTAYVVRDDGVGFDMEYADKLFTPFQRLHAASEFEGSGIGLAIIKRIINRHGGRVWTEAEVEKGAAFYFTLGSSGGGSGDNK